jgi:sodium-dependent dicarboxylate transporter 2/3/5
MAATSLRSLVQQTSLVAAPLLALGLYLLLPESYEDRQGELVALPHAARATAAVAGWMAVWWITEAIPVYATALLPLALLPLLGAGSIRQVAAPYGHELIFLFMGGFVIALAMQRWELDRRIALVALRWFGTEPRPVVGGCMLVTAALSMWVSNTATAVMMLPIAVSLIDRMRGAEPEPGAPDGPEAPPRPGPNFAVCLLLGIAYAASIGGIGTLIGTPPNLFLASYIEAQLDLEISFVRWMGVGVPLVVLFLPITWLLLTRLLYPLPASRPRIRTRPGGDAQPRVGPMTHAERATLVVFALTAGLWIFRPLLAQIAWADVRPFAGLSDAGIAILAALSLFVIPVDLRRGIFVMDWETAVRLPWGLLVLFGGGLSLAAAIQANGVGEYLGSQVAGLAGLPSFMLPVATPPNAVVFGSGLVSIPQMCRAGLWLNLIGIVLITALTYAIALPLLAGSP